MSLSAAALGAERVIITDVDSAVPTLQEGVKLNGFSAPQVQVVTLDWTNRTQAIEHIWNDLLDTSSSSSAISGTDPTQPTEDILADAEQQPWQNRRLCVSRLDYILASDVIWVDYLIPALVDTIGDLIRVAKERRSNQPEECRHQEQSVLSDPSSFSPSLASTSPIVLLAYQFRSTRSDRLLFNALDQLGLNRQKLCLTNMNGDCQDAVELDPKFQKSNLAVWKIWRE